MSGLPPTDYNYPSAGQGMIEKNLIKLSYIELYSKVQCQIWVKFFVSPMEKTYFRKHLKHLFDSYINSDVGFQICMIVKNPKSHQTVQNCFSKVQCQIWVKLFVSQKKKKKKKHILEKMYLTVTKIQSFDSQTLILDLHDFFQSSV